MPVKLYSAVETHAGPVLHQVHREDGARVRQRRFCEADDREVGCGDVAKGWDAPDGGVVVLTEEDLASLPVPSKRSGVRAGSTRLWDRSDLLISRSGSHV